MIKKVSLGTWASWDGDRRLQFSIIEPIVWDYYSRDGGDRRLRFPIIESIVWDYDCQVSSNLHLTSSCSGVLALRP